MGVLLQEFLHPPQASWAQQDWMKYTGMQLTAADFIYIVFGYTATYMLFVRPLKSSNLSHPINHATGEDDTCHILFRSHFWASTQSYTSDPSKSSDCGGRPGSTMHPANASIHGENHNDLDSSSRIGHARLRVAPSVQEEPAVESLAPALAHSLAQGQGMVRHRFAPSWMLGRY